MFQPWLHHQSGQAYLFVHKINPQLCAINLKGWWAPYRWQDLNKQVESGKLLQMTTTTCDQFLGLEKSYCNSPSLPFFFKFHYTINKNFTVNLQWIEITSVNPPGTPPPPPAPHQKPLSVCTKKDASASNEGKSVWILAWNIKSRRVLVRKVEGLCAYMLMSCWRCPLAAEPHGLLRLLTVYLYKSGPRSPGRNPPDDTSSTGRRRWS